MPIGRGKNIGKWRAQIIENGQSKSLGVFETEEDAYAAFDQKNLSYTQARIPRPTKIDIDEWNKIAKQQRRDFVEIYG